jgi:hypothetical protein
MVGGKVTRLFSEVQHVQEDRDDPTWVGPLTIWYVSGMVIGMIGCFFRV